MAMTRSLIRASAAATASPAATLREVNQRLNAHSSFGMFVTVFYAVLDAAGRTLTYANAGHNPPLLRRANGIIESLTLTGSLLGVFNELDLSDASLTLAPGDTLVAYTDGLTDALNPQGEEYGLARLIQAVASASPSNAQPFLDYLLRDLNTFICDEPPFDDLTLFLLVTT
jgi:sigma-B regulation protein RsbU (phosphoserine phosphatase)